jgi:MFS family permease
VNIKKPKQLNGGRVQLINALKAKIASVFLFLALVLCLISLFVANFINVNIVNGRLYDFGLQYSSTWFSESSTYVYGLLILLGICILVAVLSVAFARVYLRAGTKRSLIAGSLLALLGVVAGIFSMVFLFLFGEVVPGKLFDYGLVSDAGWYAEYFSYLTFLWLFQAVSTSLFIISGGLLSSSVTKPPRFGSKLGAVSLVVLGSVLTGWSLYLVLNNFEPYSSYYPVTLVGLGLLFWGVIVAYISGTEYVNRSVLEATENSYLTIINEFKKKAKLGDVAIYLPPKYASNFANEVCFIRKNEKSPLNIARIVSENRLLGDESGIVVAPGYQLMRLFEKKLNKTFLGSDFLFFARNLQRLLVDELELAQNVLVKDNGNKVYVTLVNSIYSDLYKEAQNFNDTLNSIGDSLSSALACALANSTGNPVMIENHKISEEGRRVRVSYVILVTEARH